MNLTYIKKLIKPFFKIIFKKKKEKRLQQNNLMLKKIFKIILAFSSWYKLYGKVFQTVEKPVECPSGSNQHMWKMYVFCKHLFYDQLVHHICEASRWNLIGDGHLCKFWMKGHLDITLNRLMLVELILIRYFNIHSLMHTHTHTHKN